jgi:hypothetical protein
METSKQFPNTWNALIKVRDTTKDEHIKERAELLLRQRNTAGGSMIEGEIISFLHENAEIAS